MKHILLMALLSFTYLIGQAQQSSGKSDTTRDKTAFQTSSPWIPQIDVRSDMAIVYGANGHDGWGSFEQRVDSWRQHGYVVAFMTGIAWGQYYDYFLGKWDGKKHLDIGQVQQNGEAISHGKNMPYVVPVQSFIDYMEQKVIKRVIDADITTIFLEEPEFWARAGYSQPFKQEWKKYYGFDWRAQDSSPENTYLSNKLKYHLYYDAIRQVSDYAKAYGKKQDKNIKVFIATHSLVNYSSWQIVSPEASLASLPGIDGYIAQVWTGTAREPTYFNGEEKERVFENAFLEYGSMVSMVAPTQRKLYFLTDPVEDRQRDWADFKRNYQATYIAELMYPSVNNYEVMPWPERIYTHPYKLSDTATPVLIPKYYSTQMQVMVNALNNMPLDQKGVSGTEGIGVLMGNSLMFQRFPIHRGYNDPQFSNFYGQTLPLLKRGIPVELVHMENLSYPAALCKIKVLVVSYSNMKPGEEKVHQYLVDWVKSGGVLIYVGRDNDPYQSVMEWWNSKGNQFKAPSDQLFKLLGISGDNNGKFMKVGKGSVYILRENPKEFVMVNGGDQSYVNTVQEAYEKVAKAGKVDFKNSFFLQRGPYSIISVVNESAENKPYVMSGSFINLFDPELPTLRQLEVQPGEQAFLYDLSKVKKGVPAVLATAARISNEKSSFKTKKYSFTAKSPVNTINAMRIYLPKKPSTISLGLNGDKVESLTENWDDVTHTLLLRFDNSSDGIHVEIDW